MARRSGEGRPTVYGDGDEAGTERIFPFDIVPRIVSRNLGPSRSAATFPLFEGLPCSARRAPSKPIAGRTAGWTPIRRFANAAERALGRLVAELDYTDIVDVVRAGMHDFLDAIQDKLNGVGEEITRTFFAQAGPGAALALVGRAHPARHRGDAG